MVVESDNPTQRNHESWTREHVRKVELKLSKEKGILLIGNFYF